jgi:Tfp pilus assembly protein PilF
MVGGLHTRDSESRREDFAALGLALYTMRRFEEALAAYEDGLRLAPDDAELHNGRGVALLELRRPAEARHEFIHALAADPDCLDALGNLGNALFKLNRPKEALAAYDRALKIVPDNVQLLTNRAIALRRLERPEEARMSAARAIAARPDFAPARFLEASVRLYLGDFASGWRGYEWRRGGAFTPQRRKLAAPLWLGEQSLAGKTILLHAEQGFGDTIQFVRYAPLLAARGAHVVVEVQPALVRLVAAMPGIATVLGRGAQLPPFDFHCPLPSLPLACGTALETIPASLPYLAPPQDRVGYWRARLPRCRPLIGLVWAGERAHDNDINRSMRLEALAPLLDLVDVQFVSLQHDVRETDAPLLAQRTDIVAIGRQFTDFADTAAAIAALDLVIAVDTAVAHLTGALGKPLFLLLPFAADFRWLRQLSDSPWYPTARLFRQPRFGDWASVVEMVPEEVKQSFGANPNSSYARLTRVSMLKSGMA